MNLAGHYLRQVSPQRRVSQAIAAQGQRAVRVAAHRVAAGVARFAAGQVGVAVSTEGRAAVAVAGGAVDRSDVVALLAPR